jgi:hypothetical protein
MSSKNARQPSINKNQTNKSVSQPVKPAVERTPQIPVAINKTNKTQATKETAKAKNQLDKMRPPNKIVPVTNIFNYGGNTPVNTIKALVNKLEEKAKAPDLPPLESPMGKQDDEALEEFEHPVINEKEKYEKNADLPVIEISIKETKVNTDASVVAKCDPINSKTEQEPQLTSQLDNDDNKNKSHPQQYKQEPLRDRTESEEELIKETVMLFLSDDNDDTSDYGVLPGQIVEETVRNKIELVGKKAQILSSSAKSEITVNRGLMTIITENMIVKVSSSKLIGYIAGARSESVILIFKKNNITVPIKNKDTFKTIIVSLDEILSKRSWCFPFFSFY